MDNNRNRDNGNGRGSYNAPSEKRSINEGVRQVPPPRYERPRRPGERERSGK
ncbi:hypothetical protein [Clostridium sulfidigenes]|uniref:hypothetical protein n=1 Tax=Clostridium sulfidigenes TaxID=318464 RepID=UPI003F8B0744